MEHTWTCAFQFRPIHGLGPPLFEGHDTMVSSVQHRKEIGGDICLTTLEKKEIFDLLSMLSA